MTDKTSKKIVWNKQDAGRYNALYNKLKETNKDLNKEDYLLKFNKKQLEQCINKLALSTSTRESYFFMVSKYLKLNKPNDTTISNFTNKGSKLMMERSKDYAENTLSEKKQRNFRDYTYFVDILNSINYKEIKTYSNHLQYLLLSLLKNQPPLRTSFYSSAEFHSKGGYNEKHNYVKLITTAGKKLVKFYVGKDKVSNNKAYKYILKNFIDVDNRDLVDLI